MEAEIPASNLKQFVRVLHMLHKIGEFVTVETSAESLVLRALSRAESAYARVGFSTSFFTAFRHTADDAPQQQHAAFDWRGALSPSMDAADDAEERPARRRGHGGVGLHARSPSPTASTAGSTAAPSLPRFHTVQVNSRMLLVPFRTALSSVKRVTLRLCPSDAQGFSDMEDAAVLTAAETRKRRRTGSTEKELCLMLQLHVDEARVVRTFRLPTLEQANVLQPNFSRQSCPTLIGAKAQRFLTWLQSFPDVEELSLTCSPSTVRFRSFLDWAAIHDAQGLDQQVSAALAGTAAPAKMQAKAMKIRAFVQTESAVSSDDFSVYTLSPSCEEQAMVFTLPEVRHFAAVCELSDEELFVFAMEPGQPVLLTNTRKPFLTAQQQRAAREARQQAMAEAKAAEGSEDFVASTLPPSPTSIADSQFSYNTSAAVEQTQRTWSGELILATLAPKAALQSSQQSQSQPRPQQADAGADDRRASPSPSPPEPDAGRRGNGGNHRASPPASPTYDV